jgi:hypothetical protein
MSYPPTTIRYRYKSIGQNVQNVLMLDFKNWMLTYLKNN